MSQSLTCHICACQYLCNEWTGLESKFNQYVSICLFFQDYKTQECSHQALPPKQVCVWGGTCVYASACALAHIWMVFSVTLNPKHTKEDENRLPFRICFLTSSACAKTQKSTFYITDCQSDSFVWACEYNIAKLIHNGYQSITCSSNKIRKGKDQSTQSRELHAFQQCTIEFVQNYYTITSSQ